MTTKQLLFGTKPYIIAKLLLGAATVVLSAVLFAILMLIGSLFGESGVVITFILWLGGTGAIRFALMHYFGYLVKAGHIAVITEAVVTGRIPKDQINRGKAQVQKRFATANVYFAIDKLVSGAVRQIQGVVDKAGNALDFIPGMSSVAGLAKFFVSISLGYIDECCLGYTFYKRSQGAFKSAADGVVIYAQNWKVLLKSAAFTMLKAVLLMIAAAIVIFVPVGLLFKACGWSPLIGFLFAVLIAWVLKFALLDSYLMIQMMYAYMNVAPDTRITFDLYTKLCGISAKFKELFQKGQGEPARRAAPSGEGQAPARRVAPRYADENEASETPRYADDAPVRRAPRAAFCPQCGERNAPNAKFCEACGSPMDAGRE